MKVRPWQIIVGVLLAIPVVMMLRSEPAPDIPQAAIDTAVEQMMMDPQVIDATVTVDGRDVGLAIVVRRSTSPEYGRQLGDSFARQLAAHSGLEPPTRDNLGELWTHYDMQVIVAFDADTALVQGAKARTANKIRW